jgi:hypothetical protein
MHGCFSFLVQLFDEDNYLNQHGANHYIFTTEAHIIPLIPRLRYKVWEQSSEDKTNIGFEIDANTSSNEHPLVNVHRDLVKVETNILPLRKKRANETSVSRRMIE